jgi:hypothetical protein
LIAWMTIISSEFPLNKYNTVCIKQKTLAKNCEIGRKNFCQNKVEKRPNIVWALNS